MTITDGANVIRIAENNQLIHWVNKANINLSVIDTEVWFRLSWDGITSSPLVIKCRYQDTSVGGVFYGSALLLAEAIIALI